MATLAAFVVSLVQRPQKILFLSLYLLGCFLILTGQVVELTMDDPDHILLVSRNIYMVIAFLPVIWVLFSFEVIGGWSPRHRILAGVLCLVPLATIAVAWSNPVHHLLWVENRFETRGRFLVNVVLRYGPWFWVHCVYSYALYFWGFFRIVREYGRHLKLYRTQAFWLLAGSSLPLGFNLSYVFRWFGPTAKDFSPLVFALGGLMFTVGIVRHGLGRIRPIPRNSIYEWVDDIVVILDKDKRVVDLNPAALERLPFTAGDLLGKPLGDVFPSLGQDFPGTADLEGLRPVCWPGTDPGIRRDLRVRPMARDRGDLPVGFTVTFLEPSGMPPGPDSKPVLSRKETLVLGLVTQDLSNKEIAQKLNISESTVKAHVHRMLKKAGVTQRRHLAADLFAERSSRAGDVIEM